MCGRNKKNILKKKLKKQEEEERKKELGPIVGAQEKELGSEDCIS